jgi:hypothetical protein
LCAEDERTIRHIEEFGRSVVSVKRTNYGLGWSYTIGIFDTCAKPELITVGPPPETAHFALLTFEEGNLRGLVVHLAQAPC